MTSGVSKKGLNWQVEVAPSPIYLLGRYICILYYIDDILIVLYYSVICHIILIALYYYIIQNIGHIMRSVSNVTLCILHN